ncbi:hypothetical protein [Chitinophaga sp. MM2321]|uniref:hypothetical protein n=1 Tax=Chitinophaga sp. MM2321 TaxID=3137178 RepID=UPI0032D597A0
MRNITFTLNVDGIPIKIKVRKVPKERRFQAIIDRDITEYAISDVTNELEHYEGPVLSDYLFQRISDVIKQYFPNTKAIQKVGEDDYENYDDY